ncbi:hypothetical protein [Hyperthermus butylicus]|uniref:DNA primase large subunit PriL n=1 Tax=Hyperthermus butylicus (strain DSM 5456 / JCM 9403 / PLM1-5) TaxID=415426 RepID=A2BLT4_HYPBU|nr:hypothetical protein [Hyperthermus butylicus]ABM80945.1 conserved archaeal protein [Hyperthermus butylicus DSM 5456]
MTVAYARAVIVRLERYPFLADVDAVAMRRFGLGVVEVARIRRDLVERGVDRLLEAIRRGRLGDSVDHVEEEVLSFAYAAIIAYATGNKWLVSRLALAEAERAYSLAQSENDETIAQLARLVGLESLTYGRGYREPIALLRGTIIYRVYPYSMKLIDYLRVARRLLGDDAWKPINFPVLRGIIFLDKSHVLRLFKEAATEYIEEKVRSIGEAYAGQLVDVVSEYVKKVEEKLSEQRRPRMVGSSRIEVPKGVIVEEALPPCMRDLIERTRRGDNLSHHERFALATFMLNIGAEIDYVVDLFRNMPDFNEKITRYQVEHLAGLRGSGKKYRVYSCEKMKTLGICKADCGTRSPIQAYYQSLRGLLAQRRGRRGKSNNAS